MQISREVKSYLVKTFNLLNGTSYSVDEMDGWRLYAFFRVPSDCPYIFKDKIPEDEGGMSLIQRMRKRALAGELPTSEPRRATGSKNEGGEGQNTSEGKKIFLRSNTDVSRVEIDAEELERDAIGGKWNMDYEPMLKDCREICDKYRYTEIDRKDGRMVMHKGRVWRGTRYNTMLAKNIVGRYNQWKPFIKEAKFVTIKPYEGDSTGNIVDLLKDFSIRVNRLSRHLREREGALIFRSFEWSDGAGLHAHLIIATCEERPEWEDAIQNEIWSSFFHGCSHIEDWNVEDEPWYLVKTCQISTEKIVERFEVTSDAAKRAAFSAWVIWNACKIAKVQQFAYPHCDPTKPEELPEKKPRKTETGREDLGKYYPQFSGKSAETRKEAVEIFGGTKCAACHKVCGIADWLQKYVFGDNSLQYKTLGQFIRDGS